MPYFKEQVNDIFKAATPDEWERRRKEEKEREAQEKLRKEQEKKAKEESVAKVLVSVLRKLGYTRNIKVNSNWGVSASGEKNAPDPRTITNPGLYLRYEGNRVLVSGEYPSGKDNRHVTVYDEQGHEVQSPRITLSPDKTADQMVIDIQRRFMPDYEKRLELVRKKVKETDDYDSLTAKNMRILKGKPVSDYELSNKSMYLDRVSGNAHGHINVSGNDVSIEVRSLTMQQAMKILKVIKG